MDEIEQKGLMMDQEKVTRVDFSLYAVRNTCIVSPRYGTYHRNLNQESKNNEGLDEFAIVRWVAHMRAVNNLHACSFFLSIIVIINFLICIPPLKLIEIVIMWVYYTIPFGFSLFWHFLVITFQHLILHVWLRITDEGSVPEMRIWSISLI